MKVLIAEDDAISRRLMESLLPMWGCEVISTTDGAEAWAVLSRPDPPRLAIIDWMMPGLDGLELTRRLRRERPHQVTHIIFVTAKDSRSDLVTGMDAGADDFIMKPFDPNELRVRVNAAIRTIKAHDQLETMAAELVRKNTRLTELTETAHRFVDNVSHEFRTPLTVIKEFASIIADELGGPVTDDQREYLRTITDAVNDLTQMVNDLLDSSKLKSGTLRIQRAPLDVAELVGGAKKLVAGNARGKGITVAVDVAGDPPPVFADREKATRILVNLLGNAIKFSPEGSTVRISAALEKHGQDVEIAVIDEGPGLRDADLEMIFERFKQVGADCGPGPKGFGLGLNIARELTWLNLGQLRVASRPGEGSRFAFTLPIARPAVIIDRYFARLAELSMPRRRVVVLAIDSPLADLTPIVGFLTASCYPTDLVLERPEGGLLAIGLTDEARGWIGRLHARHQRLQRDPGSTLPATLELACRFDAPYPAGAAEAAVRAKALLTPEETLARA